MSRAWGVLVLVLVGCGGSTTSPVGAPASDALVKRIAGHKFWKVPVSEADVERWVTVIEGLKQPDIVVVADSAKPRVLGVERNAWFRAMRGELSQGRIVFVVMRDFNSAPDRGTILRHLLSELDQADFRVGEGWIHPEKDWPE